MAEPPEGASLSTPKPTETDDGTLSPRKGIEADPQAMVIASLRSQIQDLFSQVTQLNNKLVQSYDRVSALEDDLHVASSTLRSSSLKISQLELERTQHLSALNTGLLVEKSHVTAELTRLMEKATEEASQRGQAESARADIEKDLDDLAASLFSQANTMVAEARFAQAQSERKVEQAELALKGAEDAVATMQQKMQALQEEKEKSDRQAEDMRVIMGKGKWTQLSSQNGIPVPKTRLLSSHLPYQEFLLFVAHLRSIRQVSPTPPVMSTLLPLPFLTRLITEDSDPTVRLDLAPSLNWLSRRSVLSAIYSGQLIIEPMSLSTLLTELSSPSSSSFSNSSPLIPGINSSNTNVSCALCGGHILDSQSKANTHSRNLTHPLALSRSWSGTTNHTGTTSWSASALFKGPLSYSMANSSSNARLKSSSKQTVPSLPSFAPQQIHIFRLSVASLTPAQMVSVPASLSLISPSAPGTSQSASSSKQANHHSTPSRSQSTIYPLCPTGWCLTRLRATCTLWAFIRGGVVDKVWEEEVPVLPTQPKSNVREKDTGLDAGGKPPVPPRRRGLWGMASALGERATSWSDGEKERTGGKDRALPPPPSHPSTRKATPTVSPPTPPPLPKRNEGRGRKPPPETTPELIIPVQPPSSINGTTSAEKPVVNGPQEADGEPSISRPEPLIIQATDSAHESDGGSFATPTEDLTFFSSDSSPPNPPADFSPPRPTPTLPTPHPETLIPPNNVNVHQVAVQPVASRTASPAPPPLPRRAAARSHGAISSVKVPESQVSTPRPASADSKSVNTPAVDSGPVSTNTPAESSGAKSDAPAEGNSQMAQTTSDSVDEPREEKSEEMTDSHDIVNGNDGKDSTLSSTPSTPAAVEPEETVVHANGVVSDSGGEPDVNRTTDDDTKINDEDSEAYIGDATWEERTWKELVKLREDLFWARVGCLRATRA